MVEPVQHAFQRLSDNFRGTSVRLLNKAVCKETGESDMFVVPAGQKPIHGA
eukprot:CAMPEP_0175875958 /NCGR_PEP_ID=MMETSP0107_2-20121207/39757_1 /TAXON_ID=195067 ORGANISM="Goniomonas pacifica, Strain CCMP1869" /NCGR_SAMPLE_ID=MMETSP0107_2 /ASSEMBLY_ACC=CAM_ASM_000203 /LENGTH=50 /DNA_ID=CAMNT_0017195061 /DNA_START=1 /DNA_END=150 /DNA_ORIENTATION=-